MEDALFTTLVETSYTVDDAYHRLALLRHFLEQQLFSKTTTSATGEKTIAAFLRDAEVPVAAAEALMLWTNKWLPKISPDTFHSVFETVREGLLHVPTMTLVVPVVLPSAEREAVGAWLRAHLPPDPAILIDVQVDERAVGGCRIVHEGRYGDFSFRYFIEQTQAALTKALASVGV